MMRLRKRGSRPRAQFEKSTVMNKTWALKRPKAGGASTGHEP
jgi:hypothetical protein